MTATANRYSLLTGQHRTHAQSFMSVVRESKQVAFHPARLASEVMTAAKSSLPTEAGWDGDSAPAINDGTFKNAEAALTSLISQFAERVSKPFRSPSIRPAVDGSIHGVWEWSSGFLMVRFPNGQQGEFYLRERGSPIKEGAWGKTKPIPDEILRAMRRQ